MPVPSASNYPASLDADSSLGGDAVNLTTCTLSGSINASAQTITTTATLSNVNTPCWLLIDSELIYAETKSGADFTNCNRGAGGTTGASHTSGATIRIVYAANHFNQLKRAIVATQTEIGAAPKTIDDTVSPGASPTSVANYLDMVANMVKQITGETAWYTAPGEALTGVGASLRSKYIITPSISSNNLTIAIKYIDTNDPSATNPIKLRVGNTEYTVTAATSYTKNAGTNWHNSGSAELAAKDVDYFVYAIGETGASAGLKFGHSRIPFATTMNDFVNTTTNEKYIAGNWTNFNTTDPVTVIGRFRAQLSAGAGYNWSIPNAKVINYPIYDSDWQDWLPTYTGFSVNPANVCHRYKVIQNTVYLEISEGGGTSNATTFTLSLPFTVRLVTNLSNAAAFQFMDNSGVSTTPGLFTMDAGQAAANLYPQWGGGNWTAANLKACVRLAPAFYEI